MALAGKLSLDDWKRWLNSGNVTEVYFQGEAVNKITSGGTTLWVDPWADPSYEQLEYLQGTGTQRLKTGVTPDNNTTFTFNHLKGAKGDTGPHGPQVIKEVKYGNR